MVYADFNLHLIKSRFGVVTQTAALFPSARPAAVPAWLPDFLARSLRLPLVSEKSRCELIVMPILLACRELSQDTIAIYSGSRLDVSPEQGLLGECDFLLARSPPVPEVQAPLVAIVEAKKNDVEAGLGQCLAQMIGARLLNEQEGHAAPLIHGCVTTGEIWQFLQLEGMLAALDEKRYFLDDLAGILGVFHSMVGCTEGA